MITKMSRLAVTRERWERGCTVVGEFVFGPAHYPVLVTITEDADGQFDLNRYFWIGSRPEVSRDVNCGTLRECIERMSKWAADFDDRYETFDKEL